MSFYIHGTSEFAHATYASLIYPDLSAGLNRTVQEKKLKFITLCHEDLPDNECVGGFNNFKRIYNDNGFTSTGNRVYNERGANTYIKPWRRNNANAIDLSSQLGGVSFTEITMNLIENNVLTVESVLNSARNVSNTRDILTKKGFLKPEVSIERSFEPKRIKLEHELSTENSFTRSFEPKASQYVLKSGSKDEFKTPPVSTRGPSEAAKLITKIKSAPSVITSELEKCFDSDGEEIDPVLVVKESDNKVCKQLKYDLQSEEDEIVIDEAKIWKDKFDELCRDTDVMKKQLDNKTDSLNMAEAKISSLKLEMEEGNKKSEVKFSELVNKVKILESELATFSEMNKDGKGEPIEISGEQILVSKVLFDELISKVTQLEKSVSVIPNKDNLKYAVNYLEEAMEKKISVMKGQIKDMMVKTSEEVAKKYE